MKRQYDLTNHFTFWILTPLTAACSRWLDENIAGESTWFAGGVCVEPRYIDALIDGLTAEGF